MYESTKPRNPLAFLSPAFQRKPEEEAAGPKDEESSGGDYEADEEVAQRLMEATNEAVREEEFLEEMKRVEAEVRRVRKLQEQQFEQLIEHICVSILEVGPYEGPENQLGALLKSNNVKTLSTFLAITEDDYEAMGCVLPYLVKKRLHYFTKWVMENETPIENNFLRIMGLTTEEFTKYIYESTKLFHEPPEPTIPSTPKDFPAAGLESNAAKLQAARRKSVAFVSDANVTGRSDTRMACASTSAPTATSSTPSGTAPTAGNTAPTAGGAAPTTVGTATSGMTPSGRPPVHPTAPRGGAPGSQGNPLYYRAT